jgi:hypothetical protein
MAHQRAGIFESEGLHVDEVSGQARGLYRRLALLDVLGARGDQQDVQHIRVLLRRTHDLIVVADFFHRKWNVLVGLHLDLTLEFVVAESLGHLNHFGDRCVAADGDRREPALGAGTLHCAPDGLADGLCIHDGLFIDRVMRRRLCCVGLDAVLAARHRELDELHR